MTSSVSTIIDMKCSDTMKHDEKSSTSITPPTTSLTIEKTSFRARLKRGLSCNDGLTFEITVGSLLILLFWGLVGYLIYVYGFNGGNWNPYGNNNNNINGR